jgi:Flp pilus assembly protein TadG
MATMRAPERGERGQAIVELALTLPLLLLIVLGVFDFGLMFQRFEVVTNAAREGARLAVLPDYKLIPAQVQTHTANYLSTGGVSGTRNDVAGCNGALSPGRICISVEDGTETVPVTPPLTINEKIVYVSYDHQHVFVGPIITLFGGSLGTTRLRAVSKMRVE